MNILYAIIMGIIQGATEFLPVSSSGHLALFYRIFHIQLGEDQLLGYEVLLHVATLVSVIIVFRKEVLHLLQEFLMIMGTLLANLVIAIKRKKGENIAYIKVISNTYRKLVVLIIVSTIPTGILGIVGSDVVAWAENTLWVVALGFFATAVFLILADRHAVGTVKIKNADYASAIFIGIAQGVATLPGISRSGATISVGMMNGLSKKTAVRYSFLLSIPPIIGSLLLKLRHFSAMPIGSANLPFILISAITAGVVGFFALKYLLALVKNKKFLPFAIYCGALGVITLILNFVLK